MNNKTQEWNQLTAIEKILRIRGGGLKDIVFDEAEQELAALRSELERYETARQEDARRLEHRHVTCTWCGWRLDYEADGVEVARATANEHALHCKADPRTAELEQVKGERDAMRDAIGNLFVIIGNHTGDEIKCDRITEKMWIAEAYALKAVKA